MSLNKENTKNSQKAKQKIDFDLLKKRNANKQKSVNENYLVKK